MSRRGANFASKLYEMVQEAASAGYVQWSEEGDFVVVTQLPQFCRLLTTYFKTTSFASFSRQLLLYEFSRTLAPDGFKVSPSTSRHRLCFYHPSFRRDRPDLLPQIKRKPPGSGRGPARRLPEPLRRAMANSTTRGGAAERPDESDASEHASSSPAPPAAALRKRPRPTQPRPRARVDPELLRLRHEVETLSKVVTSLSVPDSPGAVAAIAPLSVMASPTSGSGSAPEAQPARRRATKRRRRDAGAEEDEEFLPHGARSSQPRRAVALAQQRRSSFDAAEGAASSEAEANAARRERQRRAASRASSSATSSTSDMDDEADEEDEEEWEPSQAAAAAAAGVEPAWVARAVEVDEANALPAKRARSDPTVVELQRRVSELKAMTSALSRAVGLPRQAAAQPVTLWPPQQRATWTTTSTMPAATPVAATSVARAGLWQPSHQSVMPAPTPMPQAQAQGQVQAQDPSEALQALQREQARVLSELQQVRRRQDELAVAANTCCTGCSTSSAATAPLASLAMPRPSLARADSLPPTPWAVGCKPASDQWDRAFDASYQPAGASESGTLLPPLPLDDTFLDPDQVNQWLDDALSGAVDPFGGLLPGDAPLSSF